MRRASQGFTLIELLVVFSIMALVVGLVPFAYERMQEGVEYRETLRAIQADMRRARRQAMLNGRDTRFVVNVGQRIFGIENEPQHHLPTALYLRATIANVEVGASGAAAIRFLPNGGSTGGSIDVFRQTGAGTRLRVDWLSGLITQEPITP